MKTVTWMIPIVVESRTDSAGPHPLLPGFRKTGKSAPYDARELAEAMGATFPEGSEGLFVENTSTLVVRNTADNLERLEYVLSRSGLANAPYHVALELSVFSVSGTDSSHAAPSPWPAVADLKKLPPQDFVLLDRISGTSPSGMSRVIRQASQDSGIKASFEPNVFIDGPTISAKLDFLWRGAKTNGIAPQLEFATTHLVFDGQTRVLAKSQGESENRFYVVIGQATIVPPPNFDLNKLKAIAAKYRNHHLPP